MRKSAIDAILPRVRQQVLAATVLHADRWWYLSDLSRHLRVRPSSLQRELASLVEAGILLRKREGNRVYFQADASCPLFPELRGILTKTVGIIDVLREALEPFAESIICAFVYGSIARGDERPGSDVDMMVIGRVGLADLAPALRGAEERLGRPVNVAVYTVEEFRTKLQEKHHFLQTVIAERELFVVGGAHELATITRKSARPASRHKSARARRPARSDRP